MKTAEDAEEERITWSNAGADFSARSADRTFPLFSQRPPRPPRFSPVFLHL